MYVAFFFLSYLHISWTTLSGYNRHRGKEILFARVFWNIKGNSTPPHVVTTSNVVASTKTNPVTKQTTDKMGSATPGTVAETPMPPLSRKNFTKLPQWDFEDVYNQDAPPWQMVSMLWQDRTEKHFKCTNFVGVRHLHSHGSVVCLWCDLCGFSVCFSLKLQPSILSNDC